ncbi:flagellar export protein FliJ [Neisseriaceae bacterium JH1-16]|nr:flagellar export protein FliJ [Neisseriaceae bacterium JH1-16]
MFKSQYALLLRLATENQQAAAERMRLTQGRLQAAEDRLAQLGEFREEYRRRSLSQGAQGIAPALWQDFQRFLLRLNEALDTQQGEVDRLMQRFLLERQGWQDARKREKAFEKLLEREKELWQLAEGRRQQKISDEFATRQFWDRQNVTQDEAC